MAYPTTVRLYCGYAYESGLISESYNTANWGLSALLKVEGNFFRQLLLSLASGQMDFLFSCTVPPVLLAAIVTALAEAARNEIEHREERHLMELKSELALAGFVNLSRQHEEVMMLRHDMMRHLRTIQEMSDRAQIQNYLAELIGQNEKIRPVVQSGHEMLDILLNGKLAMAASMGTVPGSSRSGFPSRFPCPMQIFAP